MTRLSTMAPELVSQIEEAPAAKQQAIKAAACFFVMTLLPEVENKLLRQIQELLLSGQIASPQLLDTIGTLAWQFDEKYLPLKARAEYLPYFVHARGLTALQLALKDNSARSTLDAIYEIAHACDEQKEAFFALIRNLLA